MSVRWHVRGLSGWILAAMLVAVGCGDSSGSPVDSTFADNGCKRGTSAPPLGQAGQTVAPLRAEDVGLGLQCVAWSVSDDQYLAIDFVNIVDACGPEWSGSASLADDGSLQLRSEDPRCGIAGCGNCLWDWSFKVIGVAIDAPVRLALTIDACANPELTMEDWAPEQHEATLPVDTTPNGALCRYTPMGDLSWSVSADGGCGGQLMPCHDACLFQSPDAGATCDEGLVCAPRPDGAGDVCQQPCTEDGDCSLPQLACIDGMCGIASPWEEE